MQQFNVDPTFSVYALTKRGMQNTALMSHRKTMSIVSNEIENATLMDNANGVIFSSFQRMSRFLPQADRYHQLASKSEHVYVFGIVDCDLPNIDNLTYVPLKPDDQLAKEWFLVSFGYDYFTALATEELTHIDDPDHLRHFKGVWTYDIFLVGILHEWLSGIVGMRMEQRQPEQHDYQRQAEIISNTIGRMTVRVMDHDKEDDVVHNELQSIMEKSLHPAYNKLKKNPQVETISNDIRATGSA